jgi:hypothetical protein
VKNLVLTGFGNITLLDLDTIDLSNLNRQFLFRKKDVKQSKAMVSCASLSSGIRFILLLFVHILFDVVAGRSVSSLLDMCSGC